MEEIKMLLERDEIHYSKAFEIIKKMPKYWNRKEWKEKRDEILKDYCESCNSKESPFVIQHYVHPEPFHIIYGRIFEKLYSKELSEIDVDDSAIEAILLETAQEKDACPICKKITIRHRANKLPHFICSDNHEFNEPIKAVYYSKCRTTNSEDAYKNTLIFLATKAINELKKEKDREVGRLALLENISQSEVYFSMEHTKTYCKKCAFVEDLKNGKIR